MDKNLILQAVLHEFAALAKIPRLSGHEKAVSDYLAQRLKGLGLVVKQDKYNNIIADKKAAVGYENAPRVLLQGHMDMVCVAKPGVAYNPQTDSIKLKNDGKFLWADGTSLGADDGMGVASIIYILTKDFIHGPLRVVFTVDEEQGMTGARGLDKSCLEGVSYLINCDSEDYDTLTVASAGSIRLKFQKELDFVDCKQDGAVRIVVKNLVGGHSGTEINKDRGNAIKGLASVLFGLQQAGINFSLSDIKGGTADNAIPSEAFADITYNNNDLDKIREIIKNVQSDFKEAYGQREKAASFSLETTALPRKVLVDDITRQLTLLLETLHSGVYAMSQQAATLPQLSANIGRLYIEDNKVNVHMLARSATDASLRLLIQAYHAIAQISGFTGVFGQPSPAWNGNPNSKLAKIAVATFKEQNDIPMRVEFIHGGLECNYFAAVNPQLEIISIGPNNIDIHTPQEHLELSTVVPQVRLIEEVLTKLVNSDK